ncbi:MAG: hypothetical protein AMXMBFR83_12840 [Phycisphaerae bacterium]
MIRRHEQKVVGVVTALSGLGVAACTVFLVAAYLVALWRAPADQKRLKDLELAVKRDVSREAALAAERDRQTQRSLTRSRRCTAAGYALLGNAVVFLIGGKRWLALRRPGTTVISREALLRAAGRRAAVHGRPGTEKAAPPTATFHEPALDLTATDEIVQRIGRGREAAIPILQAIQSHYGFVPDAAIERVCRQTEITPAQIAGVASFYDHFRRSPAGRHLVRVCHGTACHVAGAEIIHEELRRYLNIPPGGDTDADREFTLEKVACMGCCTLAPVATVNGTTRGHLQPDQAADFIEECRASRLQAEPMPAWNGSGGATGRSAGEIRVGLGSCCVAGGSGKVYAALQQAVAAAGAPVAVKRVGCVGMCHRTPLVEVVMGPGPAARYGLVRPEDAVAIARRHVGGGIGPRLRSGVRSWTASLGAALSGSGRNRTRRPRDAPARNRPLPDGRHRPRLPAELAFAPQDPPVAAFLDRQVRVATEHCGELDPADFDEYVRHGGFEALRACLHAMRPEEVVEAIRASGLRGRGGAGYPTGAKWARVREAAGDRKYVICNGDEGDPGAFMDRMLMESFPFRVIEGLAVAAYAVGADEGYFYIRAEYPLAVRRIRDALRECERRGLLGESAGPAGLRLKVRIMEGAGAFVCGEETALLASIEGQRGMPRLRPPFPAEKGLWGRPTLINNVETLAVVPWIIRHGPAAFAAMGTPSSRGTKVFALAGKVRRGGLIEVPMGITVREIVEEIGGGVKDGRRFKAIQIGGPSGGCIPAEMADLPVDFEALGAAGAIMGSGGLVVLDDTDCMVDIARFFLAFTQDQSCGKCTFCRIGTRRMLDVLDRICSGHGRPGDLDELEQLAGAVRTGSLCGLGKTAPNPVLTTLRYFRAEYEAHVAGWCPARRCKPLIRYRVLDNCTGCTLCAQHCGDQAIAFTPYQRHRIDDARCTRCGVCVIKCPENAIAVESPCPG